MSPQEIWQAVLGEMEVTLSKAHYTTWFKNTSIVEQTDTIVTIGVPSNFSKNWLKSKYHGQLMAIITKFLPALKELNYQIVTAPLPNIALPNTSAAPESSQNDTSSTPRQHTSFIPKYTFDTFVVGNNNRLAHATSLAVAEKPGEVYNPLFIYGGVGLGKTHLVHAIGNEIHHRYPDKKILYVSCEKFTNEFIQSISSGKTNEFKKTYRNVDVLLVDDIQFLSHKEGTQEEFFHTFNALHQTNRQIVITSDRVHTAIPDLEARLSSRFGWGMVADVRPPNLETRLAILKTKCQEKKHPLDTKILDYIANQITSNIRELEGALTRILSHATLYKTEPDLDTVRTLLEDVVSSSRPKSLTATQVLKSIAKYFNITVDELLSPRRNKELVYPRQLTMYLMRHEMGMSFPLIGRELGGKDHTTIMHGCSKIAKEIATKSTLKEDIDGIKEALYN